MDLGIWESDLNALLDDLGNTQEALLALLSEKRRCLAQNDRAALSATQLEETALLERLEGCHRRREDLIRRARQVAPHIHSLRELACWLPAGTEGETRQRVERLAARMKLLQHESLSHWVLAQRSLIHLAQMLEVLASGGRLKPTYGPDTLPVHQGALVDEQM